MLCFGCETGTWVIINRFAPGKRYPHPPPRRRPRNHSIHAKKLLALTSSSDFVASPGSFVFKQAGSTHTLEAMPDSEEPVEVFFVIEVGSSSTTTTATTSATPTWTGGA